MARGNAVMKAKRVHGPTPNAELLTRVRCETCSVQGCKQPPLVSETLPGGSIKRTCHHHVRFPKSKSAQIVSRGWTPPWFSRA